MKKAKHTNRSTRPPKPGRPIDPAARAVGQFIRDLRKAKGWSQERFSEKVGVEKTMPTRWETGAHFPQNHLQKIAEVLSITMEELCRAGQSAQSGGKMHHDALYKILADTNLDRLTDAGRHFISGYLLAEDVDPDNARALLAVALAAQASRKDTE